MTTKTINIVDAIKDENLFQPFFGDLTSWRRWMVCLRAIFGLPITTKFNRRIFRECTGRDPAKRNKQGYQTALILTGRRSGKSRIAATIGAFSAALAGLESKLAAGESGLLAVVSPTRLQGRIVRNYVRALLDEPLLAAEVVRERTQDAFQLRNGNRLEILASDYRSVRGYTLLGVVVDEICFMGLEESSKIRTDTQLITSLQPSLATTNGKLVAISSPYAKSGWAYQTFQRHFGNDASQDTLVWNAPSRTMNPTLPQSVVDRAMREDLASAKSEYMAEFRDDISNFVPLELIEALVVKNRVELIPRPGMKYYGFVDLSGGRGDASALAIAHREGKKIVLDCLDYHPSPHNPFQVVANMCSRLNDWSIHRVVGDAYSAGFASQAFSDQGVGYTKCEVNKSALYGDLLPVLCSGDIELLDSPRLIKQLASLEKRNRPGGKSIVDHPTGSHSHDDLSNAVAGVAFVCNAKKLVFGAAGFLWLFCVLTLGF